MIQPKPEYYERSPDGKVWPGTLRGLLDALDETAGEYAATGGPFTLQAIRSGRAEPFRYFGEEAA